MELNAAVIGVKLYNIIIHKIDLPIEKTKFWSSSMLTLQYIQDKSHCFRIYIANRVTHILESTSAADWNFIEDVRIQMLFVQEGISTQTCCIRLISMEEIG